jgi:NhaP-type Na+/H+ or K+/H+ antiporter
MTTTALTTYPAGSMVMTTAIVMMAGLLVQALMQRTTLPVIVPLLVVGVLLGPDGVGWIDPAVFGDGLRALTAVAVAIIVFEGALLIDSRQLRRMSRSVLGLTTVGAGLTWAGAAWAAHTLLGLPSRLAFLYGALVCVTGPTVVVPLVRRLGLSPSLRTVLEGESVLVDGLGVLLTTAVFSYLTGSVHGPLGGVWQIVTNLGVGALVGLVQVGALILISRLLAPLPADLTRLLTLASVLLGYGVADHLAHESGITAVAIAGLILGQVDMPHDDSVRQFKSDLTLLGVSMLFVLLAATVPLGDVLALGWRGAVVPVVLMLVIRPIAVFWSTIGTGLRWQERVMISWMGPRGVVAASMASLMGLELKAWNIHGGGPIAPLVFLTVIMTVLVQGSTARWVARRLGLLHDPPEPMGEDLVEELAKAAKRWQVTGER